MLVLLRSFASGGFRQCRNGLVSGLSPCKKGLPQDELVKPADVKRTKQYYTQVHKARHHWTKFTRKAPEKPVKAATRPPEKASC